MSKKQKRHDRKRRRIDKRKILAASKTLIQSTLNIDGSVTIEAAGEEGKGPPKFKMNAYNGGPIDVGFKYPVVVDLQGMTVPSHPIPALLKHNIDRIVGHCDNVVVNKNSIDASGVVSGGGEAAKEVTGSGKNGFPWQSSIGARVEAMEEVEAGSTAEANGQTFSGPILIARQTTLFEISFVAVGADTTTTALVAASHAETKTGENMNFQKWVEARGLVFANLSDEQKKVLRAAYDAEGHIADEETVVVATATEVDDVKAELQKMRDEIAAKRRQDEIEQVCRKYDSPTITAADGSESDLASHAIDQGWSVEKTELEALRASRVHTPAIHSRSHDSRCTVETMQAASLLSGGVPLDSPHFRTMQAAAMEIPSWLRRDVNDDTRQRHMDAAHEFSDMSAVDICRESLRLAGKAVPRGRMRMIEAAFSTMTMNNIFTTSVNAQLLVAYMEAADTTIGWTSEADVANFLTNERIRDGAADDLERLAPDNEAKHEVPSDTEETYKVDRYAKQFTVDEQHIINDALNVLRQKPQMMGRAAARLRPDLVYSILMANANLSDGVALFHTATHGNLQASSALSEATLKSIIALIEKQTDNDATLNLRVTHLIVPSDLKHTAANLIRSSTLLYGGDDETRVGSENTLSTVENLQLVSDARLANGVTDPATGTAHSGSATTWFAASNQGHTIEVGYLRGTGRAPRVRTTTLTQGRYGFNFDVSMDIGAKALDYRALAKSTA